MQPYPLWTLYLEPPLCIRFGLVHLIRMRQDAWLLTFVNIILQKKTQDIKTIPLPNVAIPLVNPMLRTSLLCQIWGSPRDYLIQMRQIVSIQNSIFKSIRKLIFSAFGTILVLVAPLFHSKLNLENIEILIFPSFWHDIGFGGSLFLFKIQCKNKLKKNCFFQLLARPWFCIFFSKKTQKCKKIQKGYLLQTQPYPWWTLYLEPPFCIRFGRFHQDEIRDRMKKDTWCVVFSKLLTVENVIVQKNKMCKNDTSSKRSHTLGEPYT